MDKMYFLIESTITLGSIAVVVVVFTKDFHINSIWIQTNKNKWKIKQKKNYYGKYCRCLFSHKENVVSKLVQTYFVHYFQLN